MYILTSTLEGQIELSVSRIRTIRNVSALLVTLSGISQVAQLWVRDIDRTTLVIAAAGVLYLLIGLGLSGQSRFSLWISTAMVSTHAVVGASVLPGETETLLVPLLSLDVVVALMCLFILSRMRQAAIQ